MAGWKERKESLSEIDRCCSTNQTTGAPSHPTCTLALPSLSRRDFTPSPRNNTALSSTPINHSWPDFNASVRRASSLKPNAQVQKSRALRCLACDIEVGVEFTCARRAAANWARVYVSESSAPVPGRLALSSLRLRQGGSTAVRCAGLGARWSFLSCLGLGRALAGGGFWLEIVGDGSLVVDLSSTSVA